APTTHTVEVLEAPPPRPAAPPEPVSPRLVRSLDHADRKSMVVFLRFSRDGTRLLAHSDSKVIQLWDVARGQGGPVVQPPLDYRGGGAPSADCGTFYLPVLKWREVLEKKDGRRTSRTVWGGEVAVRDLATGRALPPLRADPPRGV